MTVGVELDEKKIDRIFAGLDSCRLPGAAVGIAIDGRPVYREGFGLANMELPVVLSPTTRMRIGSASKHFTSLAYLLLCEEGRAGIDDPIGKYLPELHPVAHPVTARQLMSHTSGLRDVHDICWQFGGLGRPVSSAELLSLYRDIGDANGPPGTEWNYNNGGYLMLSAAIEQITGQSLEDVLRERLFEPVGLHNTLLRRFDTDFVPNSATLHMTDAAGRFGKSYLGTALAGEGGIVSTVDDMLRWLAHMDTPAVGSPATWEAIKTSQRLHDRASTGYGLGLVVGNYRGVETLSHGGGVLGGNSQMLKVPAVGLDVVVLINRHDLEATSLTNEILDDCLVGLAAAENPANRAFGEFDNVDERIPVQPIDRPDFGAIAGRYRSIATGTEVTIGESEEGARMAAVGRFGSVTYDLKCLAEGSWRAHSPTAAFLGGVLSFDDEDAGFRFSTHRTRSLRFRREA